jgi:mannose-6-phosphate isomerase
LLVKLLDPAAWLSVQVHPNDEQARRMVGPREFGKTEAWYFLAAEVGAQIMVGVRPGVDGARLAAAIREGRILEVAHQVAVHDGDAILIPAGTLHALGPGLLLYEVQQASDTTYRIYDWDRPQSAGRQLHIEESAQVTLPVGPTEVRREGEQIGLDRFETALVAGSAGAYEVRAVDGPASLLRAAVPD